MIAKHSRDLVCLVPHNVIIVQMDADTWLLYVENQREILQLFYIFVHVHAFEHKQFDLGSFHSTKTSGESTDKKHY